jgi:glycine hydroxymethyltransferase
MSMNYISELKFNEENYQQSILNLIASENYPSSKVTELLSSVFNNKYGEGYPNKRYYAGCKNIDLLENYVNELALEVFDCKEKYGVNCQVLSGSPANSMIFLSCLEYGDIVMSLNLSSGGHLSHMHTTSNWNKFFKNVNYDLNQHNDFEINLIEFENKIIETKPKLIIIGFSSYIKSYSFKELIAIAHKHNAFVLADISHISGIIATGFHSSPFIGEDYQTADFVMTTTHKTFRGPRGALIFAKNHWPTYIENKDNKKSLIEIINKTVFPGTSGGPHFATIAGIGQACLEILGKENYNDYVIDYKNYIQQILKNTTALEEGLIKGNLTLLTRSQNHMTLIVLPDNLDSLEVQKKLEYFNIICNRNTIPYDKKSPFRPSGIRLGTPALTTLGFKEDDFYEIGLLIALIVMNLSNETDIKNRIEKLIKKIKPQI